MLLEFVFQNVLSYKNEAYFSMETGARLRKYKDTHTMQISNHTLLKSSLTFGANASGKSNLLKAFELLRSVILNPTSSSVQQIPFSPFVLNKFKTERPLVIESGLAL